MKVQLTCTHWITVPDDYIRDTGFCLLCLKGNPHPILVVRAEQWRNRCDSCRYSQAFGEDETTARRKAVVHEQCYVNHYVTRFYGKANEGTVVARARACGILAPEPLFTSEPPY